MASGSESDRSVVAPGRGLGHRLTAGLAALVLSLATGLPLRSADSILPHAAEQATPYLGV